MPQETWRGCHVLLEEGAHERGQPEGLTHSPQLWKVITIPNQYALPEYRHLSFGVLCIFRFSCKCRGAMNFWYISILKMLHLLTRCERITSNLCLFIRQARICNKFSNFSFVFIELDYSFLLSSSPGQWSRMCYIPQIGVEQNTGEWGAGHVRILNYIRLNYIKIYQINTGEWEGIYKVIEICCFTWLLQN